MNKLILLILLSIFSPFLQAQTSLINNLKKHINYLADDKLEGRQTGSKGERMAYEYIIEQYNKMGLQPMGDPGSFLQTFPFSVKANPHDTLQPVATESGKKAHNVVAYLNMGAATTVVIGAHFDHLGYAEYGNSLYPGKEVQIHNGADDNASGTAAVIELANLLKNSKSINNNYLFVNFSGEELGLFGSKYFVEHLPAPITPINYMINLDMVGRLRPEGLAVSGIGTSPTISALFNHLQADSFLLKKTESGIGPSDHTSFYLKNYPVLFFFTGAHSDYHKPSDDADKINYLGEANVIQFIQTIIDSLDNKGKLVFTKTKNDDNKDTPKFKVTLGIMPDYVYDGIGVKVDGVSDGKPAAKAGILAGDIILKIGTAPTGDMQQYMVALTKHKKGDQVKVKIKRNNKTQKVKLTF